MPDNGFGMRKTVVLGASPKPERHSFMTVSRLAAAGHEVIPVGFKEGRIGETPILSGRPDIRGVHTVTLYLGAANQKGYYDYLLGLKLARIIFNPGAENEELVSLAAAKGIETVEACTLTMLSVGNY